MALGIPTSNILQPGNISIQGGANRQLVSDLQLLTPQYYKNYVEKYGNEDFTWWLSTYGGMDSEPTGQYETQRRNYFCVTSTQALASAAFSKYHPKDKLVSMETVVNALDDIIMVV